MPRIVTTQSFIERANKVHGIGRYLYHLLIYKKAKQKVKIICPTHGIFIQRAAHHLDGYGCPRCNALEVGKRFATTKEEFVKQAKIIHGEKYSYEKSNYIGMLKKVTITCPIHGDFKQFPTAHIHGKHGCQMCGRAQRTYIKTKTKEEFIREANKTHKDKYTYFNLVSGKAREKVTIKCPIHGDFIQSVRHHLSGCGCPLCNESKGEKRIYVFLVDNNIIFERQKKFDKCVNKRGLPFDFYLPKYNICIEFDGQMHYRPVDFFGGIITYKQYKLRDKIKTKFCKDNGIKLIRIKYTKYDKIDEILMKELNV